MSWYKPYLSVYGKPIESIEIEVISHIRNNLARLQGDKPPVASVVVIAYNEEKTLLSCLWSLSENKCNFPVEIIGVNNNSTDQTNEIFNCVGVECLPESRQGHGYARQCGLDHAKGKYYISIDADIMYPSNYLQTLVDNLSKPSIVLVSSRYGYIPKSQSQRIFFFIYELLRDSNIWLQSLKRPELSVRGGVSGFKVSLGRKIGYRLNLKLGEDGSLAMGLKQFGEIKLIYNWKARAKTFERRRDLGRYFFQNLKQGVVKALKNPVRYFTRKSAYEDQPENIIGRQIE